MKTILTAILAIILLSGCRTTTETVYVDREVTKWRERIDSVYIHNTDTVRIEKKGDTIYNTTTRTKYRDRIKIERDTVEKVLIKTEKETITKTEIKRVYWPAFALLALFIVLFILFKKVFS